MYQSLLTESNLYPILRRLDEELAAEAKTLGCPPLRREAPPSELPAQTARCPSGGGVRPGLPAAAELLLRRRGLPTSEDPRVGAFPGPQGVPRGGRDTRQRAAAGTESDSAGEAEGAGGSQPPDDEAMAQVVAGELRQE